MIPIPGLEGPAREAISQWMKTNLQEMDQEYAERIELLRTSGEHPSPIMSNFIRGYASLGGSKSEICRLLKITKKVLLEHYAQDLELGPAHSKMRVAANLLRIATSETDPGAARAAIVWLDRRGGDQWKPPAQRVIASSEESEAPVIPAACLTREQRRVMREILTAVANGQVGEPLAPDEDENLVVP